MVEDHTARLGSEASWDREVYPAGIHVGDVMDRDCRVVRDHSKAATPK